MKKADESFTIKNRLHDLLAKAISLKIAWAILITIIFLTTDKLPSMIWIGFIMAVLGLNSIDKVIFNTSRYSGMSSNHSKNKETVGDEPERNIDYWGNE